MDIKKKLNFCNNCGKTNHEYKECKNPVTSYGIILINLDDNLDKMRNSANTNINLKIEMDDSGIQINSYKDIENFSKYSNSINFLMIKRKHTLGYIEFIRGRYKTNNVDGIIFLFQQMTSEEIYNISINDNNFDKLWSDFWGEPHNTFLNTQFEYEKSKEKFMILKNDDELNLNFYINNVVPSWNEAEWGFPKGRRSKQEDNLSCAKREFQEESDFTEDDFIILENVFPIIEDFIGTNGVKYRHVYYLAFSNKNLLNKLKLNNKNIHQTNEIGDIRFFNYDDALKIIRPYHLAKKKILTKVFMFVLEQIIKYYHE
jgi:8-oxo-dGTP pyrophosphatase MutT (NUDIX family)